MGEHPLGVLKTMLQWFTLEVSREWHVFVSGAPRSGTTLLKVILENHSMMCGPTYETTGIFANPDFYRDQWWEQTGVQEDEVRTLLAESNSTVSFYDSVAEAVCKKTGSSVFVDKMPWPPRRHRIWYVTSKFKGAQWVHIVRDGRDCYCSAQNHPHVPQSSSATAFAKYWRRCVESHEAWLPEERTYTVRYEDLTNSPAEVMRTIADFLGLEFERRQVEASNRADYDDGAEGAHRRLKKPISASSVGRWKTEMETSEADAFRRHAGETLQRYKYEESG